MLGNLCSEISDACEYAEHKRCVGRMHVGLNAEHACMCMCHQETE